MARKSDWHEISSYALKRGIPLKEASRAYRQANLEVHRNPLPEEQRRKRFHRQVGHYLSEDVPFSRAVKMAEGGEREEPRTNPTSGSSLFGSGSSLTSMGNGKLLVYGAIAIAVAAGYKHFTQAKAQTGTPCCAGCAATGGSCGG